MKSAEPAPGEDRPDRPSVFVKRGARRSGLLVGPIYFRALFGATLRQEFGEKVVDALLSGCGIERDLTTVALQPQIADRRP